MDAMSSVVVVLVEELGGFDIEAELEESVRFFGSQDFQLLGFELSLKVQNAIKGHKSKGEGFDFYFLYKHMNVMIIIISQPK